MIIRPLMEFDIGDIIEMSHAMNEETDLNVTVNDTKIQDLCWRIMGTPDMHCSVTVEEDGTITGFTMAELQNPYYSDDLICSEMGIYVKPEHRSSEAFFMLMKTLKKWSISVKAKRIEIKHSFGAEIEKIARLFEHIGYRRQGYLFIQYLEV